MWRLCEGKLGLANWDKAFFDMFLEQQQDDREVLLIWRRLVLVGQGCSVCVIKGLDVLCRATWGQGDRRMWLNYGRYACYLSQTETNAAGTTFPPSLFLSSCHHSSPLPAEGEQKDPAPLNHNNLVRAGGDRKLGADGIADSGLLGQKMHCMWLLYCEAATTCIQTGFDHFWRIVI